jgi:hypothetical protein
MAARTRQAFLAEKARTVARRVPDPQQMFCGGSILTSLGSGFMLPIKPPPSSGG